MCSKNAAELPPAEANKGAKALNWIEEFIFYARGEISVHTFGTHTTPQTLAAPIRIATLFTTFTTAH
jgi:hypothetical protein